MKTEGKARYWGVRLGGGGKFVEHAKKGKYVAIGWNELGNLKWLADMKRSWGEVRGQLVKKYKDVNGGTEIQVGQGSGQVIKFVRETKEGDIVVVPDMARRRVLIGRLIGNYDYNDNWEDDCPYPHRKNVEWIKEVNKESIPPKLKGSLYSWLTVFSLDRHKQEIMAIIGETTKLAEQTVTGHELAKAVTERIFNLDPEEFEHFITQLLTLVGFEATTTQLVGDKGVDVIGTLNPEGLTNITLKAQVKRVRGNIGIQDIQRLRGTLGPDEHGVFITTGGFTKQSQNEAQAEGRKPIALVDREALIDLIFEYYDELDEKYKQLFSLSKREVPLRERFYTTIKRVKTS